MVTNEWVRERIGDNCIAGDGAHARIKRQDTGVMYLTSKNFKDGGLDLSKVDYISVQDFAKHFREHSKALTKPAANDVVFSIIGTIGEPYLVRERDQFGISSSVAILRPNQSVLLPEYLFYWIGGHIFQDALYGIKGGVAQGYVSLEMIRSLPLHFPPLPTQRKIAAILSAYDDLIENNIRRIAVLEDMAQAIYREWFVHFRFPGHERVELTEPSRGKIPEGWTISTLTDVCTSINDGDWIETKDQGGDDYRLLQVSNIGAGEFIETSKFRYITQDTFERLRCQEVKPGDILVSRMPKPTGRAWLVTEMPWRMVTAVDIAILNANLDRADPLFLTYLMNSPEHLSLVEKHATGTTRPRVSRRNLSALPIIVPPIELQRKYRDFTEVTYNLSNSLRLRSTNLRQTRDLLLPRLVSGELDVSGLEIEVGEMDG